MNGWKPISSVPFGQRVLLYHRGNMYSGVVCIVDGIKKIDSEFFGKHVNPTHWHKIPYHGG